MTAAAFPNLFFFFIVFGTIVCCVPKHTGSSPMRQTVRNEGVGRRTAEAVTGSKPCVVRLWRPPPGNWGPSLSPPDLPSTMWSEPQPLDSSPAGTQPQGH